MCGFDELEEHLKPPQDNRRPLQDVAGEEMIFFQEDDHKPHQEWSWSSFGAAAYDVLEIVLMPFRALMRLMPRA